MASAKQEAANARARALGFKSAYDRRVQTALAKGKTRKEARGNHPKETKIRVKTPLPTSYHIDGWQNSGRGKQRHRVIDIPLSPAQAKEVVRLEKLGKPVTARTYVLAEVYQAPILAGIDQYQDGFDYDLQEPFPGHEWDEFDMMDMPELDTEADTGTDPIINFGGKK